MKIVRVYIDVDNDDVLDAALRCLSIYVEDQLVADAIDTAYFEDGVEVEDNDTWSARCE